MYERFYKLAAKPFQLSPDPRFFFNSRVHKRALAYLRYGIKQGEGFIIITGNVGTGKTTLVSRLFQTLEGENVVATQIVTTQIQADDLLRMVAAGFGLPYARVGKAVLLRSLEEFFRACTQEGKRVLLVVDEAQGLSKKAIEELRMLSNFQMNGRALLQSFLLGQREFRNTLRSEGFEQLRQRVIAAYHLKPLDASETRGYVEHRLRLAGWRDDPAITPDVYDGVFEFTGGVPRRINTLFDRLLLFAYLEEMHAIDASALAAVTRDITEEHGGDDPLPPLGGGMAPLPAVEAQPAAAPAPAPVATPAPAQSEERLSAVESSVHTLASAMKEELSLLRQALLARQDAASTAGNKDDEGD